MKGLSREDLAGMGMLGASGFVSAAALLWLASNRIVGIPPEMVAALLLAIQWHLVGLTLAKFGIDYAVFAVVSRNPGITFRGRDTLPFPILPCAAAFLAVSMALFPPVAALLLAAAVVLDTLTTIQSAELNARRRFAESAVGNILNYPVFVALWAVLAARGATTFEEALGLFLLTRAVRYSWIAWRATRRHPGARPFTFTVMGWIGLQGALNLLVFRSDQVLLAILLFTGVEWVGASADLNLFVFLSRFPEFATGILVLIGTVVFPRRHLSPPPMQLSAAVLRHYTALSFTVAALGAFALVACAPLFVGPAPTVAWWMPFLVQIALVLPANLVTYSMQSQGFLPGLLQNYTIGILAGLVLAGGAFATHSMLLVAWVIPAQLAVFVGVSLFASWGRPIRVFETTDAA